MADAVDVVAAAIAAAPVLSDRGAHRRWGTVTAVGTGTVDVDIGGSPVPGIPHLTSYAPETGDRVLVLVEDGDVVVLGAVA
ncbi:hypothetical protein MXD62_19385 [Frankia sp. Mgl5]|uniref:hypothetical protein n=1 Tax=Frankia sp. Mgl5 TaxID=2933793 RepID=UPI00200C4D85|nr:hypothetical protein [Frankia sp. Mgl5]MCK9929315.1 hypothetical protein [Frankia sp. Mgl5]